MATAGDIITAAFIKVGVDSPTAAQTASALVSLNNMISSWAVEFVTPAIPLTDFVEYPTTGTTVNLPNSYKDAIVYNLAIALAEDWDRVISKTVYRRAIEAKYFLSAQAGLRIVPNVKLNLFLGNAHEPETNQ